MATSDNAELLQQPSVKRQPLLAGEHEHETEAYHQIFLSYARRDGGFVRQLYDELIHANHEPFIDLESLPKGEKFPRKLENAAKNCRLGVAVLSEEYMKSSWAMRELEIFTNNRINILPVFCRLRVAEVKSPENIKRWKKEWENLKEKDSTIDPEEWEKMIISLPDWCSDDFAPPMEDKEYIDKIVRHICKAIPSPLLYAERHLKGAPQLAEAVSKQFEAAKYSCKSMSKARVIGLYGVSGLGKTTVCKITANHFCREYSGRSEIMEFPLDGDDATILDECKRVLRRLAKVSEEHVLQNVPDFDKAVRLMQRHMKGRKVFLAIDNVSQNSLDKAREILECEFDPSSKVLVTSRSEDVLKELLKGCDQTCFSQLPGMEERAALSLLEDSGGHNLKFSLEEVKHVLKVCRTDGRYNPSTLKRLGQELKKTVSVCGGDASRVKEMVFSGIGVSNGPLALLQVNLNDISDLDKHIFLDVVLFADFLCTDVEGNMYEIYPSILEWLSGLYERQLSKSEISVILARLQSEGLLGFKDDMRIDWVQKHYEALARRVAEGDARFWFSQRGGLQAKKPKRVFLDSVSEGKVALPDCSEVELLLVRDGFWHDGFRLKGMWSLRLLKIRNNNLDQLDGVKNLRHLELDGVHMLKRLDLMCARQLEMLHVVDCPQLKKILGPPGPGNLQRVDIRRTPLLRHLPDWSAYTRLQDLRFIPDCSVYARVQDLPYVRHYLCTMPRIVDLGRLTKLQRVSFGPNGIRPILSVRGVETLTGLQQLDLTGIELEGKLQGLANLRKLCISSCSGSPGFLDFNGLTGLQSLDIKNCSGFQGFHPNILSSLQSLSVQDYSGFQGFHRNHLPSLQSLKIIFCSGFQGFLHPLPSLQSLTIEDCSGFHGFLHPSCVPSLQSLAICNCSGFKGFLCPNALPTLINQLIISNCPNLVKLPHLSTLRRLLVTDCPSIEEVKDVATVKTLQSQFDGTNCECIWFVNCPNFKGSQDEFTAEHYFQTPSWYIGKSSWIAETG